MNVEKVFSGPAGYAIVIGAAGLVVWLLWNKVKGAGQAVLRINQGTPYSGYGVAGTVGNVTNQLSGGVLSNLGEWIGGKAADWFGPSYDPNAVTRDRNSPPPTAATIGTSPVNPSPIVLPYSYKQSAIDTPALLGTDAIFTPAYDTGSAGSYMESGVPGTDTSATGGYWTNVGAALGV